jgi:hypothetical protein
MKARPNTSLEYISLCGAVSMFLFTGLGIYQYISGIYIRESFERIHESFERLQGIYTHPSSMHSAWVILRSDWSLLLLNIITFFAFCCYFSVYRKWHKINAAIRKAALEENNS